jgi:hypothetical protein
MNPRFDLNFDNQGRRPNRHHRHQAQRIRTQPAFQPPHPPADHGAPSDPRQPRLWLFNHTMPNMPATVSITVNAPTLNEARGVAYLIAEDFTQKIIGQINAQGI